MTEASDFLLHVRQRLDALTYDDHSQYLLSSLQASAYIMSTSHVSCQVSNVITTSLRRPGCYTSGLRILGFTAFYLRFLLLLGTGWFLAMLGIFAFLYVLPAAEEDIVVTTTAQVIFLLSIYFLGGAMGSLLSGVCADYYGRRPVILCALGFWILVNALTATAFNYTSFMLLRLLSGMGIGAQFALFTILAIEYTPTRIRGRITGLTLSIAGFGVVGGVGYGQLAITVLGKGAVGWRVTYGVLSVAAILFMTVLYLTLEESPKYLASVGRTDEALCILEKMETAHGINRQARVTVPTSLYEPPATQRPQLSYDCYLESSIDSDVDDTMVKRQRKKTQPLEDPIWTHLRPTLKSTQSGGLTANDSHEPTQGTDIGSHESGPRDGFFRALTRRVCVLFTGKRALQTLSIWFFWFLELMNLSASIVMVLLMARRFVTVNHLESTLTMGDQLFWSAMTIPGFFLAALMVETIGRRGTLAFFVSSGALLMLVAAWVLEQEGTWVSFSLLLGTLTLVSGGLFGVLILFTAEQFPLLTRALGLSCAAAWGHVGMFAGVYLVLRRVLLDKAWTWHEERMLLATCGTLSLGLLPVILLMGPETRARDIDISWFESEKKLQPLATDGCDDADARFRNETEREKRNDKIDAGGQKQKKTQRESLHSPLCPESIDVLELATPSSDSPTASAVVSFWGTHSMRFGSKMKRSMNAVGPTMASARQGGYDTSLTDLKQRIGDCFNGCNASIPPQMDDLDQLDHMVLENEWYQQQSTRKDALAMTKPARRQSVESTMLVESRPSSFSLRSESAHDFREHGFSSDIFQPLETSSNSERYTIDVEVFDTITSISTPVLGDEH
ncbi:hypothetical protein PsorP6_017499 [Peronosclerospora sorghi]|uniref:Uncharacterized protein n=1 Tax=Peronosclerospora sorghi TaxID=230839 RepID=A0ACC0WLS5_9STRA|nr:hypothetical protein PsorP6_017499 [Peronosclerospora sorghi]